MKANIVQVLPDGHLALPERIRNDFADVKTFWAESGDEFSCSCPLNAQGRSIFLPRS